MSFAENLRSAREASGFSLEALSEQIGVASNIISQWESGTAYPRIGEMKALSKALKTDVEAMISEEEMGDYIDFSLSGTSSSTVGDIGMVAAILLGLSPGFITGSFIPGAVGGCIGLLVGYLFRTYYIKRHG